jgi:hypothetical protein
MFRALLAHLQEAPHQLYLGTLHACNIPSAVGATPPEDEKVMLETCRGP